MARCHQNRKRRQKRDKRNLLRIAAKKCTAVVYRNQSVNPAYYDVNIVSVQTVIKNGQRLIKSVRASCKPNARYKALVAELLEKCKGMTVALPRELFAKDGEQTSVGPTGSGE
jgi:hypothetical protein